MYFKKILFVFFVVALAGCSQNRNTEISDEHEEVKFQYTSYSKEFELFVEADPFVMGEAANLLSHFSILPGFGALDSGKITVSLDINGIVADQTIEKPVRRGIFSFDIKPEKAGKGTIRFIITSEKGTSEIVVQDVTVFSTHEEAHEAAEDSEISTANTTVFTKEQSWKIDYSTDHPQYGPFGQIIKTTGVFQSSANDEVVITAKTNGIVSLLSGNLMEGRSVSGNQELFTISGSGLAENNFSLKYSEAKNNFEKAKSDFERAKDLSTDKIVSEKDLLIAKNQYDNAKAQYESLDQNFNSSGQIVKSPINGFVKQIMVKNGTYVEAGQPVLSISQNKNLILTADVPQKYAYLLGSVKSANIRSISENKFYTLEQLNGKVISYGKTASEDNYLIPINLQIDNNGIFTPGSFAEVYLKTINGKNTLTVPNASLIEEQGIYFLYVQITPELFEKRQVTVGITDGVRSEILKGIADTERIVTKGAVMIKLAQSTGTLDAHSGHVH